MKTKLKIQALTALAILVIPVAAALAQPASSANPAMISGTPTIDPTTGLPMMVAQQWISPNWSDPDVVLTNVVYNDVPISEVARDLRERFSQANAFDILPMPTTFGRDWGSEIIQLQLKNVKASEVFNAMNLVFENDQMPVRWELKANNNSGRGLVLLRVLPEAAPQAQTKAQPPELHRMVYFVGNLIGDEKSGGMTMEQIVKTVTDIWPPDFGKPEDVIQFHTEAQLIVVNGTRSQLDFIQQALKALERKVELARPKSQDSNDLKELEELGRVLQTQPYSNILKSIFNGEQK